MKWPHLPCTPSAFQIGPCSALQCCVHATVNSSDVRTACLNTLAGLTAFLPHSALLPALYSMDFSCLASQCLLSLPPFQLFRAHLQKASSVGIILLSLSFPLPQQETWEWHSKLIILEMFSWLLQRSQLTQQWLNHFLSLSCCHITVSKKGESISCKVPD